MIAHLTTVHSRSDTRIRIKEVASLEAEVGRPVVLFVRDGKGDDRDRDGRRRLVDTGAPAGGRLTRMTLGTYRMYRAVRKAGPALAHFHDPELIPVGLALRLSGIKVIYDVHEDVPRQILSKYWIPSWLRGSVAWAADMVEWVAARGLNGIVAATPAIAHRFPSSKTATVQNFPIHSELVAPDPVPYTQRPPQFAYVGGIGCIRGAREMVVAIGRLRDASVRLQMAGSFANSRDEAVVRGLDGWAHVDFHGWASRPEMARQLGNVRAGLVLFHPLPNHLNAQPNKMFEYMAAGLPVIASDFALWRQIVEGAGCGLLVDPMDPGAIAEAMRWILDHPEEAEAMGRRGRKAVEETYNWTPEAEKLVELYRRILGVNAQAQGTEG